MNAVLQRHGARHIFVVPEGLKELMMDISREVLRKQPNDIYTFIADYCDALMITRENTRIATQIVDNLTDCSLTIVDLLERKGISRVEADEQAKIIQRHFRNHMKRKYYPKSEDIGSEEHMVEEILRELDLPRYRAEKALQVIQAAWKSYKDRQKIFNNDVEFINWRKALQNAMFLYRRTGIPEETARRAASKIQAAYRGYYTRRYLKSIKKHHDDNEKPVEHNHSDGFTLEVLQAFEKLQIKPNDKHDLDAIIKLQYDVRRYLARQSAKRFAHDIMHNITDKIQREIDESQLGDHSSMDTFFPKEPLTDQTLDMHTTYEGTLNELSSKLEGTFNSTDGTQNTIDTTLTPATPVSEGTEASSIWDHSNESRDK